ncbi:MAG: hypothetical protein GXY76_22730 [Chloroflexi bacterium]|nr:hypothetical protein [Chloroflexota bacterium]
MLMNYLGGAVISALIGALVVSVMGTAFRNIRLPIRTMPKDPPTSYSTRLRELATQLVKASSDVDCLLGEMSSVASERQQSFESLQNRIDELAHREKELKDVLQPLEGKWQVIADYFAQQTEKEAKGDAFRDWLLFFLGAIVGVVTQILVR